MQLGRIILKLLKRWGVEASSSEKFLAEEWGRKKASERQFHGFTPSPLETLSPS